MEGSAHDRARPRGEQPGKLKAWLGQGVIALALVLIFAFAFAINL